MVKLVGIQFVDRSSSVLNLHRASTQGHP
jgi:hypothetical protein